MVPGISLLTRSQEQRSKMNRVTTQEERSEMSRRQKVSNAARLLIVVAFQTIFSGRLRKKAIEQEQSKDQTTLENVKVEQNVMQPNNAKEDWKISIKQQLAGQNGQLPAYSIFKIPDKLHKEKPAAYSPQIVSIGPLHHKKSTLVSMDTHKIRYRNSLFKRVNPDTYRTFNECAEQIESALDKACGYYAAAADSHLKLSRLELAELFLLDGCFILELFYRVKYPDKGEANDPIFRTAWMMSAIRRDLTLLENQIPFFILEILYRKTYGIIQTETSHLMAFVLEFFKQDLGLTETTIKDMSTVVGNHLLDIYRRCYLSLSLIDEENLGGQLNWQYMRRATALKEAGVKLKCNESPEHTLDIKFHKGIFLIPKFVIHDGTDSLFRNLIAFEQCYHSCTQYITSYALLMDRLLDNLQDVEILERKMILDNDLGEGQEVSSLFNNLCKEVILRDFYFEELCTKVDKYCKERRHRYRAALCRDYFKNPWTVTSFIAACLLLALTLLQSVYTVLSYYKGP